MKDRITVEGQDGAFGAYIARPRDLPAPAAVILHEVFGVNADIRATCNELAAQGFIAIAPDLFWRQEPGVDLNVRSEADWQHGLRLYAAYDRDAGARDVMETVRTAVELPESTGKVALQGYCLGALMAFITAARYEIDAAVAYHGGDTEKYLGEVGGLDAPLADAPRRRGRIHLEDSASSNQSGARKKAQRHRLQLSGSASRLLPAQWDA
jgi:carboxymethylenebutenolidase